MRCRRVHEARKKQRVKKMVKAKKKTMEEDELNSLKTYLENGGRGSAAEGSSTLNFDADALSNRFWERFTVHDLRLQFVEPGRIICSMKVPPRLLGADNRLHGGATAMLVDVLGSTVVKTIGYRATGVSVEISVSFFDTVHLDEEIEIEAKALRIGKTMAAVSVEFRRKSTGETIAQGRHTKYIPASSKL